MEETWDIVFRDTTRLWVEFIFVPVVVLIGVIGNSLTIFILTRKKIRLSSEIYMMALTMSDLLFLLFFFSMSWKHYKSMQSVQMYWKYIPFGLWFTDASSSTSIWLTVAFTIERYVAICHPLLTKSRSYNTQLRAVVVATCVYFCCYLITAPTSMEWHAVEKNSTTDNNLNNNTLYDLESTDFGKKIWYRLIYRWFSTILFVLLPLLILTFGNFFLINAVRSSQKVRENLSLRYVHRHHNKRIRRENRMTMNLIAIVIIFLICQLPTASILIYTSMYTVPKDSVEGNVLLGLSNIFNLLVAINAECNFILYTATSEKYRKSFFQILRLDSVLQRIRNRKHRVITLNAVHVVNANEEKVSFRKQVGIEGSSSAKECTVVCQLQQKKSLLTMRKCSTHEQIRTRPPSSSSSSIGATSL